MERKFRLTASPFSPAIETPFDMAAKLHVPYSAESVTVQVSPNITHYEDRPSENVRQVMVSVSTPETQTLVFDLGKNRTHQVRFDDCAITLRLESIGTVTEQGQAFRCFDFIASDS